jgi:hypothetical protein
MIPSEKVYLLHDPLFFWDGENIIPNYGSNTIRHLLYP